MKTLILILIANIVLGLGIPSVTTEVEYTPNYGGAKPIENTLDTSLFRHIQPEDLWKVGVLFLVVGIACYRLNG